jgi:pimeloyl-ACP methyl ester carboxylesterase
MPAAPTPATKYPEGTYAEVPGARLYYIDTGGSGVPVVFMHAATGSSQSWEYQISAFTAAGYRLLAFDRRGRGRTEIVPESGPQPGTGADDLGALLDMLGIDRIHLVGTAAGAFTVLDFAVSWPERLYSLVAANSIYGIQDPEFLALITGLRPQPQFNTLPPDFRELGPAYRAANPEGVQRWLTIEHSAQPPIARPAQGTRNRLTLALLETITRPTLLLTGGADLYAPPPVQQLLAARMGHAETLVIPEAGHSTYWEQPDVFNHAVLAFLQRTGPQSRNAT